ncbi:acyl-CoA dehydrogenase family protein [Tomitella cavernea]|uniref:acyl-CoA dehydrogenase family protein n=1 Tax=Tomitella cavernea TaxID=1387982 RepID=UPI001904B681|nr:acyl-CoA dehydrogenase [Tomitella cavernea]
MTDTPVSTRRPHSAPATHDSISGNGAAPAADVEIAAQIRAVLDGRWAHVRESSRAMLDDAAFLDDPSLDLDASRRLALEQMRRLARTDWPASGFGVAAGGTGDPGGAVTGIEMLAYANLSLMVKAGVQWGLFGGAVENLGTERHHREYIAPLIRLDLLGCFAMTEIGHGSDVQNLETTATFDPGTDEIVVHTPTPSAVKDYIGGAALHARMAAVFAQLITHDADGTPLDHGVHCVLVPIRDDDGGPLPGVTTTDDGLKGGLRGVDNGRIAFDHVRVPRTNLLNRYGDIDADGRYTSPIDSRSRRFFTMLGTLIRGRISVGGSAGSAARVALEIAVRYAEQRRQFSVPGGGSGDAAAPDGGGPRRTGEVLLMDYLQHQRRLLPLLARSFALGFAQNELVSKMHDLQVAQEPDQHEQRELESRAAGLKASQTWHATRVIQECREACGGAGYMTENHLTGLKADSDVFTTFEGDNTVLTQLVAKELLTSYSDEVSEFGAVGWMRFVAETVADTVRERTAARQIIQRILDRSDETLEEGDLAERSVQLRMFEDREQHVLETAARRLRRGAPSGDGEDGEDPLAEFEAFNSVQDHVLRAGRVHIERVVLEAFLAGIDECPEGPARDLLEDVCTLYALHSIEEDKAWFMEHGRLSTERAKAVTRHVGELCTRLRPHALTLVTGFGIPRILLDSAMLDGPGTDPVRQR